MSQLYGFEGSPPSLDEIANRYGVDVPVAVSRAVKAEILYESEAFEKMFPIEQEVILAELR